jgi:hypothetical protein
MALILTGNSGSTTLDSSAGLTFSDSSNQQYAAGPYVLKNRLINGSMQIWQRGTSATLASYGYLADRWASGNFVSTQVSQSTSVPSGFQYSLKVQRASGATSVTSIVTTQTIESVNMYDLAGQTVTVSFWVKAGANYSASGNTFNCQLNTGSVADQGGSSYTSWTNLTTSFNYTPTLTTSWQKFTVTGTMASNALEAILVFYFNPTGTAGADDSFYITGVQLEVGSTATPFERRLYNQELANCQRYYEVGGFFNVSYGSGGTSIGSTVKYAVVKRAAPTFTQTSTSNTNCSATPANASTGNNTESILSYRTGASGGSQYSETWIASAEL